MTTRWVDRTIFTATSAGLGDFVVASAVTGYLTPAQSGAIDGESYHYAAQTVDGSGNITGWEIGTGSYTVSSTTIARTTIEFSSNSNNKVNFATAPQVMITFFSSDVRIRLNSDTTFYVATTGSDTNNGLTAGTPFATIQFAIDFITDKLDCGKNQVTVQIAAGTYDQLIEVGDPLYTDRAPQDYALILAGAGYDLTIIQPTNALTPGFNQFGILQVVGAAQINAKDMRLDASLVTTYFLDCIYTAENVHLYVNNMKYVGQGLGNSGGGFYDVDEASTFSVNGEQHFFGTNIPYLIYQPTGSFAFFNSGLFTFHDDPAWTTAGVFLQNVSRFAWNGSTWTGTVTGKRFQIEGGAEATVNRSPALTYLPGSVAGTAEASGYIAGVDDVYGHGNIVGGFTVTPGDGGTISSGTFTPAAINGNYQFYTNNGAHSFAVPAADSAIDVLVTNGASAGAISFSGSYRGGTHGDSLTTTLSDEFIISVRRINGVSAYIIKALQ